MGCPQRYWSFIRQQNVANWNDFYFKTHLFTLSKASSSFVANCCNTKEKHFRVLRVLMLPWYLNVFMSLAGSYCYLLMSPISNAMLRAYVTSWCTVNSSADDIVWL